MTIFEALLALGQVASLLLLWRLRARRQPRQVAEAPAVVALAETAARDVGRSLGLELREAAEQLHAAAEALRTAGKGQPALRAHLAAKRARERAEAVLDG